MTAEREETGSDRPVDMGDQRLLHDPFAGYSRIRERAPLVRAVMPGVGPVWLVTRYDDVKTVLGDGRFVVDPGNVPGMRVPSLNEQLLRAYMVPPHYLKYRMARMGMFDGAAHARLRTYVAREYTVRRVTTLRPLIEATAERLLDRLPATATGGVTDLLGDFALPLSATMLCEVTGIPEQDRARWDGWRDVIAPATGDGKEDAWHEVIGYVGELMRWRQAEPADDLISRLLRSHAGPDGADGRRHDPPSETEAVAMVVMLGMTSQQTAHLIGNGVLALLRHPDQLATLRADPGLLPQAVHELLRWCAPTVMTPRVRYATEDLQVGGMPLRKGEAVAPVLAAANHDPRRFEHPERLDITRVPDRRPDSHVAFGGGPHYCLGAALARLEGEVAFGALLHRHPDLALAVAPEELDYSVLPGHWQLNSLPVRLAQGL